MYYIYLCILYVYVCMYLRMHCTVHALTVSMSCSSSWMKWLHARCMYTHTKRTKFMHEQENMAAEMNWLSATYIYAMHTCVYWLLESVRNNCVTLLAKSMLKQPATYSTYSTSKLTATRVLHVWGRARAPRLTFAPALGEIKHHNVHTA